MISFIKKIYSHPFLHEDRGVISLIFYKFLLKITWCVYYVRYRRKLKRTSQFLDEVRKDVKEKRKSAFVFANGPSLSKIDLSKVKKYCEEENFDLISVNSFLSKSATVVRPNYAVFADNGHFSGGNSQYMSDIDMCKRLGVTYFAPAKFVDENNCLMYGYCSLCDLDSINTSNILRPVGYYGMTAFFAISLAKMLGYKNIYLCGFDNSYFKDFEVSRSGEMFIHHKHYYDSCATDTIVPCIYKETSEFFFDVYRHFYYIHKITKNSSNIKNIALDSYLSDVKRDFSLDVYNDGPNGG